MPKVTELTYQLNRFITLMENADDAAKNYEIALNSAGSANQKFAIYQESAQAKIDKFKSTLQGFYQTLVNSEGLKSLIDSSTDLIQTLQNVTDYYGTFTTAIYTAITALIIFKTQAVIGAITAITEYITVFGVAEVATYGLATAMGVLTSPITLVVGGLAILTLGLIDNANQMANLKAQTEKTNKSTSDFYTALNNYNLDPTVTNLNNVATAFQNLDASVNFNGAIAEINRLNTEIFNLASNPFLNAPIVGSIFQGRLQQSQGKRDFLQGQVDKVNEAKRRINQDMINRYIESGIGEKLYNTDGTPYVSAKPKTTPYTRPKTAGDSKGSNKKDIEDTTSAIIRQINAQAELDKQKQESLQTQINLAKEQGNYNKQISETENLIKSETKYIKDLTTANQNLSKEADKVRSTSGYKDTDKWFDASGEKSVSYINQYNKASDKQKESMDATFNKLKLLKDAYGANSKAIGDTTVNLANNNKELEQTKYDEITNKIHANDEAITSLDDQLAYSEKVLGTYTSGSEEYRKELDNQVSIIKQLKAEKETQIAIAQQELNSEKTSAENKKKLRAEILKLTSDTLEYAIALEKVKENLRGSIVDILQKQEKSYLDELKEQQKSTIDDLEKQIKGTDQTLKLKDYITELNAILNKLDNINGKLNTATSQTTSTIDLQGKISQYKSELENIVNYINAAKGLKIDNIDKGVDAVEKEITYSNELKKKIDEINQALEQKRLLYQQQEEELQKQIDSMQEMNTLLTGSMSDQLQNGEFINADAIISSILRIKNELSQVTNTDYLPNADNAITQLNLIQQLIWQIQNNPDIELSIEDINGVLSQLNIVQNELNTIGGSEAEVGVGADISQALANLKVIQSQVQYMDGELINLYIQLNTDSFYNDLNNVQNAILSVEGRINSLISGFDINNPTNLQSTIQQATTLMGLLDTAESHMSGSYGGGGSGGGGGENPRQKELEEQIKSVTEEYEKQIEAQREKLKLLDEEIDKEDRLQKLNEINDELTKTKNDKRFSYITAEGVEIFTYNQERVDELEKERDELLKQYEREDVKKAINDEIDRLEKAKDDKLEILQEELDNLKEAQDAMSSAQQGYTQTVSVNNDALKAKLENFLSVLEQLNAQQVENEQEKADDLTETHNEEIEATSSYLDGLKALSDSLVDLIGTQKDDINNLYDEQIQNAEDYWNDLIEGVTNGTIGFNELMSGEGGFYTQATNDLKQWGKDVETEINKIKALYAELDNVTSSSGGTYGPPDVTNGTGSGNDAGEWEVVGTVKANADGKAPSGLPVGTKVETNGGTWEIIGKNADGSYISQKLHDGGIVGGVAPSKTTQLVNRLFNTRPNEQMVKALLGELFTTPQNIMNNFIPNMQNLVGMVSANKSNSTPTVINQYHFRDMTIKADNVSEFLTSIDHLIISQKR